MDPTPSPAAAPGAVPLRLSGGGAGGLPRWRGFGDGSDLEVDFSEPVRSEVVTRLLAACWVDGPADPARRLAEARALTLSGRIGGLCEILTRSRGAALLALHLRCPAPECGEGLEVDLPLDALASLAEEAQREPVVAVETEEGTQVRVRRPTGEDQRRWRARAYASPLEAERAVLASLLLPDPTGGPRADLALLDRLGAAMQERDPLPGFRLETRCPACGETGAHPLDLEVLLTERLEARQRALLREVHRLASRYGWSEAEVMAVPARRRRAYLALIDGEVP